MPEPKKSIIYITHQEKATSIWKGNIHDNYEWIHNPSLDDMYELTNMPQAILVAGRPLLEGELHDSYFEKTKSKLEGHIMQAILRLQAIEVKFSLNEKSNIPIIIFGAHPNVLGSLQLHTFKPEFNEYYKNLKFIYDGQPHKF